MLPERAESNMPYSDDLRRKLVEAWLTGEHTPIELAELFHVSLGGVEKGLRRWRESGDTAAAPFHHGRYALVSPERVRRLVARHDDATLAALGRRLRVSAPPRAATCSGSGCLAKKMLPASERDTPRVQRWRARGRQTRRGLDPCRLIFIDESGLNLALTRRYARTPRGVRAVGSVPPNYGQSLPVLAALDGYGMRATLLMPGATDREVFLRFLQPVLGPQLRPGAVVVMDNLTAHKGAEVAEA